MENLRPRTAIQTPSVTFCHSEGASLLPIVKTDRRPVGEWFESVFAAALGVAVPVAPFAFECALDVNTAGGLERLAKSAAPAKKRRWRGWRESRGTTAKFALTPKAAQSIGISASGSAEKAALSSFRGKGRRNRRGSFARQSPAPFMPRAKPEFCDRKSMCWITEDESDAMRMGGASPAEDDKLVGAFLKDDRFLLASPNAYNSIGGGTTQLYDKRVTIYDMSIQNLSTAASRAQNALSSASWIVNLRIGAFSLTFRMSKDLPSWCGRSTGSTGLSPSLVSPTSLAPNLA